MTEERPAYQPPRPFSASFEGWTPNPDDLLEQWPNSVRVEAAEGYDSMFTGEVTDEDMEYADYGEVRHLVEVDTNYKPTRDSEHPVRLTRGDAVKLAGALLEAVEDTFHASRCGRLRAAEAKDLLDVIRDTEYQLGQLREHALFDLLVGTGLAEDPMADYSESTPPVGENTDAVEAPTFGQEFAVALREMFGDTFFAITTSEAYGALKHKVTRRCEATGETPSQVLAGISDNDRAFTASADDPAAFLASRIES